MKETMGQRLKRLRLSHGLTLEEVGKIIGVQKTAVLKYEKDQVKNMKRESIQRLADYYGVSPTYLLCMTNEDHIEAETEMDNLFEEAKTIPCMHLMLDALKSCTEEEILEAVAIVKTLNNERAKHKES